MGQKPHFYERSTEQKPHFYERSAVWMAHFLTLYVIMLLPPRAGLIVSFWSMCLAKNVCIYGDNLREKLVSLQRE